MVLAGLSAVFAGLTALLAKLGVENVPSNLATLVRTVVVLVFAAAIVAGRGEFSAVPAISVRSWTCLALSGVATGASWLCYFGALKLGPISGVAPIDKLSFLIAMVLGVVVLREPVRAATVVGAVLIACGVLLTIPTIADPITAWFGTKRP